MSFDCSRFSFHPWKDFLGVVMQQGRVQLDADWNEWVAELARRLQAGTMDTVGRAVVPRITPDGFRILATGGALTIGPGRMYVDGLLAENHGAAPLAWDASLAETTGTGAVSAFEQPYLPFNATDQAAPADVFNRPALAGGPHLVYLDVWQRELTYLQEPGLVEKAVGVDTTGRLQTVWQVKVLRNIGNATCTTPDANVPGWPAVIRPSGARLTTDTGDVPGDPNPCLVPPAAGYKGLENQLYRVEIHRGGSQANATFKWSRDNATVASRVMEIHGGNRLVVESVGRDDVLGFHAGEWIEVLDDWHELHRRPGLLRRIRAGDGVDTATRSIFLDDALPAGLFPVDAQNRTDATRHTRIRRWDQSGQVRRADGSAFHDLDASASSDGIPVPPAGTQVALENGILVELSLAAGPGEFKTGDYWVFAARSVDGSIELLDHAPPRGIHHHYARLAVVTLPDAETDCRVLWPPEFGEEGCDCTVCVEADGHNAGTATIQQAIEAIRNRGGTICLGTGVYRLDAPLNLTGVRSLRIRGQGWMTVLQGATAGTLVDIQQAIGVTIENLAVLGMGTGDLPLAMITAANCIDLNLSRLAVLALGVGNAASVAIDLSGVLLGGAIRECMLVADHGVVGGAAGTREGRRPYLLTAHVRVTDNLLLCRLLGISFGGVSLHYGELRLAANLVLRCANGGIVATGGTLPAATVTITDNVLHVVGTGVRGGTDGLRITDNEIVGTVRATADGIALEGGLDPGAVDHAYVTGNRIHGLDGHGIAIRRPLGQAMIKSNVVVAVTGSALVMEEDASADYLGIENNHFTGLGVGFNAEGRTFVGVQIVGAARADITANLLGEVARQATQSRLRVGFGVLASGDVRLAGNRVFGMGPLGFHSRSIALAVETVREVSIHDNSLARVGEGAEVASPTPWQAIVLTPFRKDPDTAAGIPTAAPAVITLPAANGILHLSAFRVGLLVRGSGSVAVRGNRVRGQSTVAPLVDVDVEVGCIFTENDAELSGTQTGGPPVGRIAGAHVNAANNRLIGLGDQITLLLTAPKFAVLGNMTSGPIRANGAALPAPWNDLNVGV
jgi:hypothetical protein